MAVASPYLWMTPREIAEARLPGLPHTRQGIAARAAMEGWEGRTDAKGEPLTRARAGRGGGVEYHVNLLPEAARVKLVQRRAPKAAPAAPPIATDDAWAAFEQAGAKAKAKAAAALAIVQRVEALTASGLGKVRAVEEVAATSDASRSTINAWFAQIAGIPVSDRLPYLAPRYTGGGKVAEIDADLWQVLKSDYLRLERPTWESCARRAATLADATGKTLPDPRTLWRRLKATVSPVVITLRREGVDAMRRHVPPQTRSVAELSALEIVNIDGHTCDVRVRFPDGTIGRPTLIAIQDVFSRKMLAWRYAPSEDAVTARMVFADLFEKYGIPKGLLSDNGRAFACRWLAGQIPTRHRFAFKEEEPHGLFSMLGIEVHWARPYRGQSKPIERAFNDFCDDIARHPAFAGAYTGNNALNKPDNYGERVMEWDEFVRWWDAGIAAHNARVGRTTEMACGVDSFDTVFTRSYQTSPIRKATESQLRLALMAGEQVRAARDTGAVKVLGNVYWHEDLTAVARTLVTVRFDPEDATKPVHVYAADKLVAVAPLLEAEGFLNAAAAKRRARLESDHRKKARAAVAALDLLTADQLTAQYAALLPAYEDETPLPEPTIIAPVRVTRGGGAAARKVAPIAVEASAEPSFIDHFAAGSRRLRVVE